MNKNEIFQELKNNIVDVIPEVDPSKIKIENSLKEIGANSVDRMDIIVSTMQMLNVKVPLVEFAKAKCIEDIVNLFYSKMDD